MNQITERDMLAQMESGQPFAITVITFDEQRKRGGEIVEYPEVQLVQAEKKAISTVKRSLTPEELRRMRAADNPDGRDPNHQHWYTRNVRVLQNGHPTGIIRKIHPPLVVLFNSKLVMP